LWHGERGERQRRAGGHVSLEVECVDRLYLDAYCPLLQVGGQVVRFLTGHLGHPVTSPALFQKIGNRFRREVDPFAASAGVPVLHLKKPDRSRWDNRKLDHVRPHLDRAAREQHFGVVAIVVAQEFQWVTGARNRASPTQASADGGGHDYPHRQTDPPRRRHRQRRRHLVDAALAPDGTAVAPPRSADKLEALTRSRDEAGRGRLLPLPGDLADEREASALLERLPWRFGPRCHTADGGVRPECAVCQASADGHPPRQRSQAIGARGSGV
jgi:hypothetical protein